MKKRMIAMALSGMLLSTFLAGCGNGNADPSGDATGSGTGNETGTEEQEETLESGTIPLTVWAEADNFEMLNQMIESFKDNYAGQAQFEITLVEQGEATAKDTLLSNVHEGADVFSIPDDQLTSMIAAGALAEVENQEAVAAANIEESVEAASYNGILYAYPYTADNGYFLYYDKRYLSESDVQTMDGLLAAASAVGKRVSMEMNSGWYLYSFFGQTGMEFGINDDGVTNYCNWNTTEGAVTGVDIAQGILDIARNSAFVVQPDADFLTGAQSGEIVAGISGVWNAVAIKEAWGEDYGACKLPTYTCGGQQIQMSSFTGYKLMGVNAYSEHPQWAQKLAEWLTNEENQTLRFEIRNQGPSNINAAASDAVSQVPAIQAVLDQGQYGTLQRVGNNYWDPCTAFAENMAAGNPQGTPLQELMDTLVEGITRATVE